MNRLKHIGLLIILFVTNCSAQELDVLSDKDSIKLIITWQKFVSAALNKKEVDLTKLMRTNIDCLLCSYSDSTLTDRTVPSNKFVQKLFLMMEDSSLNKSMLTGPSRIWTTIYDININAQKPPSRNHQFIFYNIGCLVTAKQNNSLGPDRIFEGLIIFQFIKEKTKFKLYAIDSLP